MYIFYNLNYLLFKLLEQCGKRTNNIHTRSSFIFTFDVLFIRLNIFSKKFQNSKNGVTYVYLCGCSLKQNRL